MAEGTAALRAAAAHWSLAGDQQLLDVLQGIHQRILSRCNETATRLELMSRGLRDASVNLQNVNNKFLALSNTQFVESRVYEDDADLAPPPAQAKEPPQLTDLSSDLSKLKQSLQILENYHEPLHILRGSDSDSDSDGGYDRLVLKPKDLYSDRPLPYIIGSQAWKSKWHAGLIQDDSDSDSSTSKVEEVEQYSESEDEQIDRQVEREYQPARKQSTGSSSAVSEQVAVSVSPVRPSPSLVAAELARRLGGDAKLPDREPVYSEPDPVVRKLYKPQQTPSAQIFPDEPPPLDETSDEDIFAELHKPQKQRNNSNVEDTLFDFSPKTNSLEDALFGRPPNLPDPNENQSKPPLFDDDLMPEVRAQPEVATKRDDDIKKPVGGISLFGTNQHAKSIGAAILNRNRRKSSTSGDESNTEEVKITKQVKEVKEVKEVRKERDIFDDLFAKSEKLNKKSAKIQVKEAKEVKKDAFSDIFDDIDDIFSTDIVNVQIKETKKSEKPLFDDDDDLFAEIPKVDKEKVKVIEKNDLFDETPKVNDSKDKVKIIEKKLFDDSKVKSELSNVVKELKKEKVNVLKDIKKSLFDSDSDDGIFSNIKEKGKIDEPVEYKISDDIFGDDNDDLFAKSKTGKEKVEEPKKIGKATEVSKTALFDSDDELFTKGSKAAQSFKDKNVKNDNFSKDNDSLFVKEVKRPEKELKNEKSINSNDSFESDQKSKALKVIDSINNDIFNDGDDLFKKTELKESKIDNIHDSFDNEELFQNKMPSKDNLDKKQESENSGIVNDPNDFESKPNDAIFNKPDAQIGSLLRTTRIAADEANTQTDKPKEDIFSDSDEELFKTKPAIPKPKEKVDKNEHSFKEIVKPESQDLFSAKTEKNDIFSDIFDDVPPIFEKPKEPKKSQNVNALYGDDSDDEALFFKKNDVISDEKPDFSPSEERFGIFNDEPPALDVDFIQKPVKTDIVTQNVKTEDTSKEFDDSDDLFKQTNTKVSKSDDDLFKNAKKDTPKVDSSNPRKSNEKEVTTPPKETQDTTDNLTKEPKKVGKLKPMNFNINVNSLLPGASPKKKQFEETDGQTASNEELHKTDKLEPKMVKSISFDDPEVLDNKISKDRAKIQVKRRPSTRRARREAVRKSAIDLTDSSLSSNDNSQSDVKVKTVYILNDDDIFGDDSKNVESTKKHLNIVDSDEELFGKGNDEIDSQLTKEIVDDNNDGLKKGNEKSFLDSDDDDLFKNKDTEVPQRENHDEIKIATKQIVDDKINDGLEVGNEKKSFLDSDDDDLFKNKDTKKPKLDDEIKIAAQKERKSFLDSDDSDDLFKQTKTQFRKTVDQASNSEENLFKSAKSTELKKETPKSFLDSDDNDDLFTNKTTAKTLKSKSSNEDLFTTTNNKGIETLGKVYKETQATKKEIYNVFDDFPPIPMVEEKIIVKSKEIIKKETKIEKAVVKKSILDVSSDEDDLFKAKTKLTTKKDDRSLFGDDNVDDDDLFGAKNVKEPKPDMPAPQSTKEAKPTETVFVDPLSLFGDDD